MICGPSGVGKSLFLHIYKKICQEKHGPECRIETVNCSHFSGDLARSELFGHVEGAFTGALRDKEGWLRRADNGILILEEIGDLPRETQANLLTFVETSQFHKVGSTITEKANVHIVAATNRENRLRTDFRHRFFPFYIPPLYQRRYDILYYLAHQFPQLMPSLAPWEIMVLLAYNWPGNVREVEKVGRLLMCKKQPEEPNICPEIWEDAYDLAESEIFALPAANSDMKNAKLKKTGLCAIDSEATALKAYMAFQLYNDLKYCGVDVDCLETLLNRFNLGLAINNESRPFDYYGESDPRAQIAVDSRFDVAVYPPIAAFAGAYMGIEAFAALFWSLARENVNLLDIPKTTFTIPFAPINRFFKLTSRNIDLFSTITAYIRKKKRNHDPSPEGPIPNSKAEMQKRFLTPELYNLNYYDLSKTYFKFLLKHTAGNQAHAARIAGLKYTTFRQKLKKFGVT